MIEDRIKLYRKAGGSIIDHKPVFSANSKILYVGSGPLLRAFSTHTGELIRDLDLAVIACDTPESGIVDISMHPFNKNEIIVCFEEGRIITWSFEANSVVHNIKLDIPDYRVVRMKIHVVSEEFETFDVILAWKSAANKVELLLFAYHTGDLKTTLPKRFDFLMHSWSVTERGGKDFIAGISGNALNVFNLKTSKPSKDIKIGGKRYFTCVSCHPSEECIAAADNTGRVLLYYDFLNPKDKSPYTVYHWHTLPVNDVVFTFGGSSFISGGNEHVLVKWTVSNPDVKYFLPRLPAPIVHVTVAPDNQFVAVSTLDNGVLIVDAQNKIHCSVQNFTWGFLSVPGQRLFPGGLAIDPRSNCIVLNGKPGHIQFFSPQYSSLIYNMDIVSQNYVSQERNKNIANSEVVAMNFSPDGNWLATSQFRDDPDFKSDTILKFWMFDRKSQSYKLTSYITLQHNVKKIIFQPFELESGSEGIVYFVATLCSDNKFRFWINNTIKHPGHGGSWTCHSIGYYKDYSLNDIAFSCDGSLLGAAFGPCFTVWDTETNNMKCSLTKGSKKLNQVAFCNGDCSFIAVTCTDTTIYAWNLLSLTLAWSVDMEISCLLADPRSEFVAAFTMDNSLYVYRASSSDFVYKKEKICKDSDILNAIFFPATNNVDYQNTDSSSHWLCNSSLYFFTSAQNLLVFEYQNKETKSDNLSFIPEKSAVTPFQALVASEAVSSVEKSEIKSHLQLGASWSQTVTQFIQSPAHAMPPVHLLTETLLRSLIISRKV